MMQEVTRTPTTAATVVVPPHVGSGPLTPAQLHRARVRIVLEELTEVVQAVEAAAPAVRHAACQALAAVVELQAALQAQS